MAFISDDQPESEYPNFTNGDVKIIITGSRQYLLHSATLKDVSPVMRGMIEEVNLASLSSKAVRKGVRERVRLVATKNHFRGYPNSPDVDLILAPVKVDSEGRPEGRETIGLDLENGRIVDPFVTAYDAILGAFYSRTIKLGDFGTTTLANILENALYVVQVAEYLQVVHVITAPIEAALLGNTQTLYQSIAQNPSAWIEFARRIKSRPIFREALILAAGKYQTVEMMKAMDMMDKDVLEVLQKKARRIYDGVKTAQSKMLSYYPDYLRREERAHRVNREDIGRASYANDIMTWMGMTAFRHFLAQNLAQDKTHVAEDMGFALIEAVNQGGDAYCGKSDLEEFHRYFPMTGKGKQVVESKVIEFKEHAKQWTLPLLKNHSQLDKNKFEHPYFTCTIVSEHDYPWVKKRPAEEVDEQEDEDDEFQDESEGLESTEQSEMETEANAEDLTAKYVDADGSLNMP